VSAIDWAVALMLMLGPLVLIHELGHFIVARLCGVRVLKFSIGFGPTVGFGRWRLAWTRSGTEYVVAWFPLGGFVKMLGEISDDDQPPEVPDARPDETLRAKPLWQKLAILFAGPAMNLLLPVVIFVGLLAVGLPRPEPVVGLVEAGSPAARAGLSPGDRILALDGKPVQWWDTVEDDLRTRPGQDVSIRFEHQGRVETTQLDLAARSGLNEFGGVHEIGWAGLGHARLRPVVGVPEADAAAARAGLRSGDRVVAVAGAPIEDWEQLAQRYAAAGSSGSVSLAVERGAQDAPEKADVSVPALGSLAALGVVPASVLVSRVSPDSPAEKAGLAAGDLLLTVDGAPIGSFASFAELVRSSGGRTLQLTYARQGETRSIAVQPAMLETDNGLGIPEPRYLIGIEAAGATLPGVMGKDVERNPLRSIPRAVSMTYDVTKTFLAGLGKLLTGEVSHKQLSGPIGIAEIAHKAIERGFEAYLSMLVLISINLGVLNLLPIPVLDGGQALLFTIEGIKRSPVSVRTREIVQQLGVTVLILLMGLAFWNDLSRHLAKHWTTLVDWLRSSAGL
jgi:regulator of sigma E protease